MRTPAVIAATALTLLSVVSVPVATASASRCTTQQICIHVEGGGTHTNSVRSAIGDPFLAGCGTREAHLTATGPGGESRTWDRNVCYQPHQATNVHWLNQLPRDWPAGTDLCAWFSSAGNRVRACVRID